MSELITVLRGDAEISDEDALDAFSVLVPLLAAAPEDEEARQAAVHVVARMSPVSLLAAVLDWWLVVEVGAPAPLGMAFHLPDELSPPAREAMDALIGLKQMGVQLPPGRWVAARGRLEEMMDTLDHHLQLDSYGRSKIPTERDVWELLQDQIAPTVEALRASRRAGLAELDPRAYEKALVQAGIDENSRRWKEMVKRAEECVTALNEIVHVHQLVEPWLDRPLPPTIEPDDSGLGTVLGRLHGPVLGSILRHGLPENEPLPTSDEVAARIRAELVGARDDDQAWLAAVADGWMRASGVPLPELQVVIERRERVQGRIDRLREAGADVDEAELLLLDHELGDADTWLDELEEQRRRNRREDALQQAARQLREALASEDMPVEWVARLERVERALRTSGDDSVADELKDLARERRAMRRQGVIEDLEELHLELDRFDAPTGVLVELREHLDGLAARSEISVDEALVQRTRERLRSLVAARRRELEDRLRDAHDLLEYERQAIRFDALPDLEFRLSEAEAGRGDDELMHSLQVVDGLLADIASQRVHLWSSVDGESALVEHVIDYCTQQLHFSEQDVRRLFVAAKTKPFIVLAGLTGSGKSTIARLFAAALGADARNGRFRRVAVRPDWIDQSEVLGSINPLRGRFEPGWLAETARHCERNLDQIHVVLLDEMNLAPVEQYLAEYLSALEEARSGADATALPLYPEAAEPENAGDWPASLPFPRNLILIGTVNVDETTRVLSERVLDRANVLQLSSEVSDAHHRGSARPVQPWSLSFADWEAICVSEPDDAHHELLVDIGEILRRMGIGLGQRAHVELERFVANARGILDAQVSLDVGVLQRVIPKLRGFKRDLAPGLAELRESLLLAGCERSADVVARWLAEAVPDDDYLDGTDARIGLLA